MKCAWCGKGFNVGIEVRIHYSDGKNSEYFDKKDCAILSLSRKRLSHIK